MANLSNINNKFLVTTTGEVLIGQTSNNGNRLQITGADGASYIYLKTDVATTGGRIGFNGDDLRVFNQQASGELNLGTAGTTKLTISSTGNVGIGAAPLQGKLDILNNGDYDAHTGHGLAINSSASNAFTSMYMGADDSIDAAYIQSAGRNTSFTSKKLLLNPNGGNVGIGETNPAHKLSIKATDDTRGILVNNTLATSYAEIALKASREFRVGTGGSTSATDARDRWYVYDATASTHRLTLDSSGNFGIGTTSPSARLEVYGTDGSRTHFNEGLRVTRETVPTQYGMVNYNGGALNMIAVNTAGTGSVTKFMRSGNGTSLVTSMVIDNDGNVGIGTTGPGAKLVISGGGGAISDNGFQINSGYGHSGTGVLEINPSATSHIPLSILSKNGQTANLVNVTSFGGTAGNLFSIASSGNVGIGTTTPSARLSLGDQTGQSFYVYEASGASNVKAGLGVDMSGSSRELSIFCSSSTGFSNGNISFGYRLESNSAYQERMRLTSGGNLGIGTTAPSEKLTVDAQSADGVTTTIASFHSNEGESGDTAIQLAVRRSDSLGSDRKTFLNATGAGNFEIQRSGSTKVTISGAGDVGIGTTTPARLLQLGNVNGARSQGIGLGDVGNNLRGIISCDTGTNDLILASTTSVRFFAGSTFGTIAQLPTNERMCILSGGNVGIGVTSPWVTFAVTGTTASNSPSITKVSSSTTAWTSILTFSTGRAYSVLLSTSENAFSQMWRVSGSVNQQTCYYTMLGDSGHPHSKDAEFRMSGTTLQYKNINYTTARYLDLFDVVQSSGSFTY